MQKANYLFLLPLLVLILSSCGGKKSEDKPIEETPTEETNSTVATNEKAPSEVTGTVTVEANGETFTGDYFDPEARMSAAANWTTVEGKTGVGLTIYPSKPKLIQLGISLKEVGEGDNVSGSYAVSKSGESKGSISATISEEDGKRVVIQLDEGSINVSQVNKDGTVKLTASGSGTYMSQGGTPDSALAGKSYEDISSMSQEELDALGKELGPKSDIPVSFSVDVKLPEDRIKVTKY